MPAVTAQILVDLDGSGAYATDITEYCWRSSNDPQANTGDVSFNLMGVGRAGDFDAAGSGTLDIAVDNRDGRFTPKNGSSPYASGGVNLFRPFILIKVIITFNAVDYTVFNGIVTNVLARTERGDQTVYVTAQDFFVLLSRTEVRRPLMRDQRTGVILHRILDDVEGAEDREAVTNPRFETNTSGYAAWGTATITRMTTGFDRALILEGPASLKVDSSLVSSGVRYTLPDDLAGLKYQVTAYVKPEIDADIGDLVRICMRDTVGNVTLGSFTAMANRDIWTRLTVNGTYGGTEQYIDIESGMSSGSFRVGAVHATPFVNAITRDIDDGQATLAFFTEYRGKAHEAIERVRRDEQFALFYFDGSGQAVFHDKTHRWRESHSLTVQSTFDERGILDYSELADDRIKTVRVDYPVHVEGTAGQVIAATDKVIPIPAGQSRIVFFDYDDGIAKDVIVPVAGTDYQVNVSADGTGVSLLGSITLTFQDLGSAAVGIFANAASWTAYLQSGAQVRGTSVRLAAFRATAEAVAAGGPALAAEHGWSLENNASEPYAQSGAEYVADRYSTQRERLTAVHSAAFPEPRLTSDAEAILARGIGDRVRYTQDNLPFSAKLTDADYYIDSIDLSIPGENIQATWRLSPVDEDYGRFDVGTFDNAIFGP